MRELIKRVLRRSYSLDAPFILNRGELPHLLNARGLVGEGAEIGVKYGQFSECILESWKGRRLYQIDPWQEFSSDDYVDGANVSQPLQDATLESCKHRLSRFGDRSVIVRELSVCAARRYGQGQLDFVYIDARHDYEGVKEDLAAWHDKVRAGGLMSGHDYINGLHHGTIFGVKRAVTEFAASHGYRVLLSKRERNDKSWFIFKT